MKKKFFLFLFPILLFFAFITGCEKADEILGKSFVSPGRTVYETGDSLDLTGGKVVYYYLDNEVTYDLTTEMLDSSTIPTFEEVGEYTIKGSYEDFKFEFDITINEGNDLLGKSFIAPGRSLYQTGDELDLTGAKIVYYYEEEDIAYDITKDMLDSSTIPNFKEVGEFTIKGSYEGFAFEFDITIEERPVYLSDVEVALNEQLTAYTRSMDVADYITCREVYSNETTGEWYSISSEDVSSITVENGEANINLSFFINNEVVNKVIKLPVTDDCISVKELKEGTVDTAYLVKGVVVAVATTVSRNEIIIADKETGDLISVAGLEKSGTVHGLTLDLEVEVGDEIIVPVVLKESTLTSDFGKLYAQFNGGTHVYNTVVSKDNTAAINYTNILTVDSQADLIDMLSSTNRGSNVYQVVKLVGQMNFITYQSSRHFRFWFEDGNIDNYNDQKIEGNMSPCFCDGTQYYTTGKNFAELVFGDPSFVSEDWANPATQVVEMYALFIGGNGYYHEFVILDNSKYQEPQITNTNTYLIEPEVTKYVLDSTLSIEGAKIVKEYDLRSDEVIEVTMDMIDPNTIPDFKTEGTFTVKGTYEGFNFEFEVVVESKKVTGISIDTMPTKLTYGHRDSLETIDLTDGKILVEYSNNTYDVISIDASMLPTTDENWKIGVVEYTLTYGGCTTVIPVTYENQALSIAEVLTQTVDKKYDVTGVVLTPASSAGAIELLIKDKNSNMTIGIYNSGVAGSAAAPELDTDVVNVGDEIIVTLTLKKGANAGGSLDKLYLTGGISSSLIIVSKGNSVAYDKTNVEVIDTQEKLVAFLNSEDRFYKYVKIVQPKAVAYKTSHLRLFFGEEVTTLSSQKVNGYSPVFHIATNNVHDAEGFTDCFENVTSTSYSAPATSTYSFYAVFVGGNAYYHIFAALEAENNA